MATIADVYRALNSLVEEKIVEKYAVCGGTAALFYDTETLRTYDIDIFVFLPQSGFLIDLSAIYSWGRNRGYGVDAEHLMIHNVPVRVLVAGEGLELEALETANILDYDGVPVPVVKPEYLVLLYAKVGGRPRIRRALDLLELDLNENLIAELVEKYDLQPAWAKLQKERA